MLPTRVYFSLLQNLIDRSAGLYLLEPTAMLKGVSFLALKCVVCTGFLIQTIIATESDAFSNRFRAVCVFTNEYNVVLLGKQL